MNRSGPEEMQEQPGTVCCARTQRSALKKRGWLQVKRSKTAEDQPEINSNDQTWNSLINKINYDSIAS